MAPSVKRLSGPSAVRTLLAASLGFQEVVKRTVIAIQGVIDQGLAVEQELEYAQLLLALAETERALEWVAERCRVLLGEQEEERRI